MKRITVTLTREMADMVETAVAGGDYASASEIVREALRHWRLRRIEEQYGFEELKTLIDEGVADIAAGRVVDFDPEDIKRRGRERLRKRKSG